MSPSTSFGRILSERRKILDLTQDELAQRVGCALVTIKKIESDRGRPSKHMAERLAEVLRIPAGDRETFLRRARVTNDFEQNISATEPQSPRSLPRGTLTFLFTDIEGSTRLWEQQPDAMRAALIRHDMLLREAIAAQYGVIFKTVGDSFYAIFVHALDALKAAINAQRAIHTEAWPTVEPLRVRIALHTGVVEPADGDYFGPPLNRAARLLTVGAGGQVRARTRCPAIGNKPPRSWRSSPQRPDPP
ncbi:MAG: helix-turn-helix domain-containing protein [Chloroflexota bacterium]|nr:helix-turn-helix domain-containing protein [Chloroflexota bacterium]